MMGIGVLFWLAIIAGAVALVVWLTRSSSHRGTSSSAQVPDALEIARRRYASGEISKEQFEQLRNDLSK